MRAAGAAVAVVTAFHLGRTGGRGRNVANQLPRAPARTLPPRALSPTSAHGTAENTLPQPHGLTLPDYVHVTYRADRPHADLTVASSGRRMYFVHRRLDARIPLSSTPQVRTALPHTAMLPRCTWLIRTTGACKDLLRIF
eukprot:scaffold33370_cov58-Phaeocystis_antarctica.AAC.6